MMQKSSKSICNSFNTDDSIDYVDVFSHSPLSASAAWKRGIG